MAHAALVGDPGQAAGAGQNPEQGHFGQADGARAVIHQDNFVAGEGEFVPTPGAGAVDRGDEAESVVARRIFQAVAGFVGELAEVDLPGVTADAEHEDVGARAENLVLEAGDDNATHLRMLEADTIDGVVEFDVDAEVVAVQFELVAWPQARVFVKIGLQGRHRSVNFEAPVPIACGFGLIVNAVRMIHDRFSIVAM